MLTELKIGKIYRFFKTNTAVPMFYLRAPSSTTKIVPVFDIPLLFVGIEMKEIRSNDLYVFLYDGNFYYSYDHLFRMGVEEFEEFTDVNIKRS